MELGVTAVMLPELDFPQQVALCQELGIRYYQYRPRVIPEHRRGEPYSNWGNHRFDLTPERLRREGQALAARLRDAGLEPWGTLPSVSVDAPDDELRLHLEGAAAAEARSMRCAPPRYPDEPFGYAGLLQRTVERYAHVVDRLADPMGVKLVVETHSGSLAAGPGLAWSLLRHFPPHQVGAIFDMANFAREGEVAPRLAVAVLRDHIDCCHVGGNRRVIRDVDALGAKLLGGQMCAMEDSDLHLPTWLRCLAEAGVEAPLIIEDFAPHMPGARRLRRSAAFLRRLLEALEG
ncbi:MAG: sugar phosphate isomerase/epimerase family protein [Candidatus Brocadiia bacterium]